MLLAFLLRLYRIDNPIADWHAWRQTDTAAVTKIFVRDGIDPLHPRYFDISNVQSGSDNPKGYRFVEFPLFNILHATLYSLFPIFSLDMWGRLTTILFSISAMLFIFLIVRKFFTASAALFSAFFYAVLPFSVFYGRSILPDTAMIAAVLGAIYFFSIWIGEKRQSLLYFFLALLFTISSLLFKPYALFFLLPMAVLAFEQYGISTFKRVSLWIFAILSILPFALWRVWIMQFPEGIPVSSWLFNAGNIRFKGAYFYWIFGERISKLIFGYYPVLAIAGLFKRTFEKHFYFFLSFLVSSFLYLIVIARGNVQHDYYQIAILPSLAIFAGRGVDALFSLKPRINKIIAGAIVVCLTFFMISLSWYYIRDYFNINNPTLVEAGKKADELLPKNARVIAPMEGDTTLLYYIARPGWPSYQQSTEELIEKGATHAVLLNPDAKTIEEHSKNYTVIASESSYLIVEFQK